MRQEPHHSVAQLHDIFQDASIERIQGMTRVRVDEDSPQEMFLRHIQMRAGLCQSRFMKEFQTLSAAAVPKYEFTFNTQTLRGASYDQAQKLGWVLDNLCAETPYEFTRQ